MRAEIVTKYATITKTFETYLAVKEYIQMLKDSGYVIISYEVSNF